MVEITVVNNATERKPENGMLIIKKKKKQATRLGERKIEKNI
jgi:hypothetical protein